MRKKDGSMRDTLLECARNITETDGIGEINIRSIAQKAGIATGTVYNYFSNKEEILLALTEEYWEKTLLEMRNVITSNTFCGQLEEIFYFLKERIDNSAGKLMNSLRNVERTGQERMISMQSVLEEVLIEQISHDPKIRRDIWNETFTKRQYVQFIMINIMILLKKKVPDFLFFITIVKRTIY